MKLVTFLAATVLLSACSTITPRDTTKASAEQLSKTAPVAHTYLLNQIWTRNPDIPSGDPDFIAVGLSEPQSHGRVSGVILYSAARNEPVDKTLYCVSNKPQKNSEIVVNGKPAKYVGCAK